MNDILKLQNEEDHLKLLRARRHTYTVATRLLVLQFSLTVLASVAGGTLGMLYPNIRPHVAALALLVIFVDVLILDRQQKVLLKRAAKIGEQFDCTVLSLPWDGFTVGDKVEAEDIYAAARAFARRYDDSKLLGWYPKAAGEVPLHLSRIICQRTNLRYDSKLRRSYGIIIQTVAILIVIAFFVAGVAQNLTMTVLVLTMAPALSVLNWATREYYRQRDTAELQEDLMKRVQNFWRQALAGEYSVEECVTKSREFQNAIYMRRANSPLVMPFIYSIKRSKLENEMNEGAEGMLREISQRYQAVNRKTIQLREKAGMITGVGDLPVEVTLKINE